MRIEGTGKAEHQQITEFIIDRLGVWDVRLGMMDMKLGGEPFRERSPPFQAHPPTSKSFVFIESLFVNVRSALYGAFCFP